MNSNFIDGTYTDALLILDKLEQRAKLMADAKDDAMRPSVGTSEKNDRRYHELHELMLKFSELDMTRERFYAACDLIRNATRTFLSSTCQWPQHDSPLIYYVYRGTDQVLIFIEHNRFNLAIRELQRDGLATSLPAPVSAFPFAAVKQAMLDTLTPVLSGCIHEDSNRVYKAFDTQEAFLYDLSAMYDLEEIVREHDKAFTLDIKLTDSQLPMFLFSVDKASLEQAKRIIGYVGNEPKKESTVQKMMATSPILSSNQRAADRGNEEFIVQHGIRF